MRHGAAELPEAAYSVEYYALPFEVRTQRDASHTLVAVAGEIDVLSAGRFDAALDAALADTSRHVWVDLSEVEFLGAAALHSLLRARSRVGSTGRRMILVCPTGGPRRVLELAGFDATIAIYSHPGGVPRAYR